MQAPQPPHAVLIGAVLKITTSDLPEPLRAPFDSLRSTVVDYLVGIYEQARGRNTGSADDPGAAELLGVRPSTLHKWRNLHPWLDTAVAAVRDRHDARTAGGRPKKK